MYLSERIGVRHRLGAFRCGRPVLDRWLQRSGLRADAMGTGRTYVWTEQGDAVVAYFTLCPHEVRRDELPSKLARGAPHSIPAILLARLALDERLHGQGLGASLLLDALTRAAEAVELAGGRLIVVDAIDEQARHFYEHHGFRSTPSRPVRLYRKASDVLAAIRRG